MSKKYIPQQMVSQSRFIDLYNEWNEEYRALLTRGEQEIPHFYKWWDELR